MGFRLAACAEMFWPDRPIDWRAARLAEMGFDVGLWNWPHLDLPAMERSGARFCIMNGFLQGGLADEDGAEMLLASARETAEVGKRLGVRLLNLTGTSLGDGGIPLVQTEVETGPMWLTARDTLNRLCDFAEEAGVTYALENLNPLDHPGCPFGKTGSVLAIVAAIDRPQLRINLDLYHTQIGEGDLIRWVKKCLPWIGEIQVADNPGRFEPGTGEINYPAIARALRGMGYEGTVTFEGWPSGTSEEALGVFQSAFAE